MPQHSSSVRAALTGKPSPRNVISDAAAGTTITVHCDYPTAARAYYERAKKERQLQGAPVKISLNDSSVTVSLRPPVETFIKEARVTKILLTTDTEANKLQPLDNE